MGLVNRLFQPIQRLLGVPAVETDDAWRRRLLNILLLVMALFTLVELLEAMGILTGVVRPNWRDKRILLSLLVVAIGGAAVFLVNRFWSGRVARWLFLFLLASSVFIGNLGDLRSGRSLISFAVPIVAASVLVRPYVSLVVACVIVLAVVFVGAGFLGVGVDIVALLAFFLIAVVSWIAAQSLERVMAELQAANRELDQRVCERTSALERRSVQLRTASEVARDATVTLEVEKLLDEAVRLISERFGFYHAGVFLLDEKGEYVVLRAASSEGGRRMLARKHKLAVGKEGIVGHVAETLEPLVVLDVGKEAAFLLNPDLPATRSEMALPLTSRGRLIGVLDVQSTQENIFTAEDVATLQTMADQLANAIENARLFDELGRRVEELAVLHNIDMAITSTLNLNEVLRAIYEQVSALINAAAFHIALYNQERGLLLCSLSVKKGEYQPSFALRCASSEEDDPLVGQVIRTRQAVWIEDVELLDEEQRRLVEKSVFIDDSTRAAMMLPLIVRDRVVGVMSAQSSEPRAFGEDDRRLFTGVARQAAIAITNAWMYEEMARHTRDLRLLADASAGIVGSLDPQGIVNSLLAALVQRFRSPCSISLMDPDCENASVAAVWMPDDEPPLRPVGFSLRVSEHEWLRWMIETRRLIYIPDVERSDWWSRIGGEERELNRRHNTQAILILPMLSQERLVGVASLRFREPLSEPVSDQLDWAQALVNYAAVALANAQLYRKLEAQAEELSRAYEELKEIDRLRAQLVQNVSHELRTPLGLIKGYIELLLDGDLGPVAESQRAAMQVIRERTAVLARLVNNLTVLQATPQEVMALTPISVIDLVRKVLASFLGAAQEAGVVFREYLPDDLPLVMGDRDRLELVFGHLVDNAIKFSPGGGVVTLRAWSEQESVCVSVSDEGIGIPPEHLDRIFERFYQVDGSTKRRFGGMGIGLALVWEVVEAHGGTVRVESEPGKGSTFIVSLPRQA